MTTVCQSLDREWAQISSSPSAVRHLATWAAVEPDLAGYRNPGELLVAIATPGRAELAHDVLRCLLRQAADPVAARTFLQAVLPALRAAKAWYPLQDHWADQVAATWEAIRVHAGESPQYPARFIVRIAERSLRTRREARSREAARLEVLDPDADGRPVELEDARGVADQIAIRVLDAYRAGKLTEAQARLLYATAVVGMRTSHAGRALRCRSVYRELDTAGTTLLRVSA